MRFAVSAQTLATPLMALGLAMAAGVSVRADVPRVVVDSFPVHALAAQIMAGLGAPEVLLAPGRSPHDFALRASDAQRLSEADLVLWTGAEFTPWLAEALSALAKGTPALALLGTEGWPALPLRTDPQFEDGDAGQGRDRGADLGNGDVGGEDGGEAGGADGSDRVDPHAWLDPAVATVWGHLIAGALIDIDPDNAGAYRANAAALEARLDALADEIDVVLDPLRNAARTGGKSYLVGHDAYQYFERRFALPALGAIALTDARDPGPARLAALRAQIVAGDVVCILGDAETAPALLSVLTEGTGARVVTVDPDGVTLSPGPDLYDDLLRGLAAGIAACLG